MPQTRLAGRTALVTGGSRGIGRAVAELFAAEGAAVAVNHVRDAAEAEETIAACRIASRRNGHGDKPHLAIEADVGDAGAASRMVAEAVAAMSRLDILVANAGIQTPTPGDGDDAGALERIIQVNLIGAAHCARAAIRHFLARPGGGIILATSSAHETIPKPGFLAYSMSKGGLANLTRTLALEFAGRGIRVNAVAPGAVLTSLNDGWRNDPVARAKVESHIPMGRSATSEEIAASFVFLASDDAAYITGQTLYVDGGITLYADFRDNWSS